MTAFAIALVFAAIAGIVAWTALTTLSEKATADQAMLRAVGEDLADERELVLAKGRKDRLLVPFLGGLSETGRRITPVGFRDKAAKQLRAAGRGTEEDLDRYLALRTPGLAVIPLAALAVLKLQGLTPPSSRECRCGQQW